jgi:hypothetical protein
MEYSQVVFLVELSFGEVLFWLSVESPWTASTYILLKQNVGG